MPEGADQPAMQAQLDYGAMTVEQMRQRLVQGISGCEDREVLARLCALLEGSGEGTSVAPLDIEGDCPGYRDAGRRAQKCPAVREESRLCVLQP